jgi:type II secretory ATPase GspE/PulE/Tfp pilus assembly ATPase PilB-like protein
VFELLELTDELRDAIVAEPARGQIETIARARGMLPHRSDGWAKVRSGVTTIEEVLRVTQG